MRRLVIIDQDGNTEENNIIEKLFSIREEEIERPSPVRNQYIKENNLKDVTHDMIIDEIEQNINLGVRIDIWTHLMRGCIINYVY